MAFIYIRGIIILGVIVNDKNIGELITNNRQPKEKLVDQNIMEKHITKYVHGIGLIITGAFIFIFLADLTISILVYFGYFPFHMQSIRGGQATYKQFLSWQIITQLLTAIPFIIYFLCYKKANFAQKKTLLCALTITTTAVLCFCHWKNHFISFLFAIPVVITSPLDRKRHEITSIISEVMIILYALFHNLFHEPELNYLVAAISSTTLAMFYLVSYKMYTTINGVFAEIKEYKNMQEELHNKIAHDVLTGAYSKSALDAEMKNFEEYSSMAFLDIDNFKMINDENGHHTGDSILKLLSICLRQKDMGLYRNGGDEFVILSKIHTAEELATILDINRKRLSLTAQELYNCKVTLSIGIININKTKTPQENIQTADKLMYVSKNNGRDRITVEG